MDSFERTFPLVCFCLGVVMFMVGIWYLIGGVNGLRQAIRHIKDWF